MLAHEEHRCTIKALVTCNKCGRSCNLDCLRAAADEIKRRLGSLSLLWNPDPDEEEEQDLSTLERRSKSKISAHWRSRSPKRTLCSAFSAVKSFPVFLDSADNSVQLCVCVRDGSCAPPAS